MSNENNDESIESLREELQSKDKYIKLLENNVNLLLMTDCGLVKKLSQTNKFLADCIKKLPSDFKSSEGYKVLDTIILQNSILVEKSEAILKALMELPKTRGD